MISVRSATLADLDAVSALEARCFPTAEAASRAAFRDRLSCCPRHFHLLFEGDRLAAMVNGMPSAEADLRDEMYADISLCREDGRWLMIFGVATDPDFRRKGYAGRLLRQAIDGARAEGRAGVVLTCKEGMIPYYSKFGFVNEGLSGSVHGNARWFQMRVRF